MHKGQCSTRRAEGEDPGRDQQSPGRTVREFVYFHGGNLEWEGSAEHLFLRPATEHYVLLRMENLLTAVLACLEGRLLHLAWAECRGRWTQRIASPRSGQLMHVGSCWLSPNAMLRGISVRSVLERHQLLIIVLNIPSYTCFDTPATQRLKRSLRALATTMAGENAARRWTDPSHWTNAACNGTAGPSMYTVDPGISGRSSARASFGAGSFMGY